MIHIGAVLHSITSCSFCPVNVTKDKKSSNDISNAKIEVKKIKDDLAEHRQQLSRELANLTKKGYGAIKIKSTDIKPKLFSETIWKRFRRLFSK